MSPCPRASKPHSAASEESARATAASIASSSSPPSATFRGWSIVTTTPSSAGSRPSPRIPAPHTASEKPSPRPIRSPGSTARNYCPTGSAPSAPPHSSHTSSTPCSRAPRFGCACKPTLRTKCSPTGPPASGNGRRLRPSTAQSASTMKSTSPRPSPTSADKSRFRISDRNYSSPPSPPSPADVGSMPAPAQAAKRSNWRASSARPVASPPTTSAPPHSPSFRCARGAPASHLGLRPRERPLACSTASSSMRRVAALALGAAPRTSSG